MRRSLVVSLALLAIVRSPAVAQSCLGMASFSSAPVQVAAGGQFSSPANSWNAGLSYGLPSGLFAGADLSTTKFDGVDASSLGVGAHAGYEMSMGKAGQFHVCPVASLKLGMGPDIDAANLNGSSTDLGFGLAVGTSVGQNPRMRVLPTAGLGLQYSKIKAEDTSPGGTTAEFSETYPLARLGIGFIFNQQISVRPSVDIPISSDLYETSFGVTVAYNFGSRGVSKAPRRH
ncbi:MAG: outer membrane beta-barrel protein [Gemmatimonadales bacterium]